jgi:predicted metalloprotease
MRWQGRRQSDNVEDRRQMGGGTMVAGGGLGTIIIVLVLWLGFGVDPMKLLQQMPQGQPGGGAQQGPIDPRQEKQAEFVRVVLADTEDVWTKQFAEQMGAKYREPTLVMFSGNVRSACGFASAASGPFYCPEDEKVYIDLSFFDEMQSRLGAKGEFARAYVIAHEIGHHVQKQLGLTDQVHSMRGRVSKEEYNEQSVRLELQADFLAGVWAHYMQKVLEPGDIKEAMECAAAIGDDKLQREAQGYVVPDSFTHGTSEQRMRWFMKGYKSGRIADGNTFGAGEL